ncbi:MAG: hypothetical protein Q4D04_06985 [Clostridia bacterium]|nr:hypothetical protein [Clostridia bacterium]
MINRIKDAFDSVHAQETLKQNTKEIIRSRIKTRESCRYNIRRFAVACACFVLVVVAFGGWHIYMTPVSAISINVNPSVELGVNRFERVIAVNGFNDDGMELIESVNMMHLPYLRALEVLMYSALFEEYLEEDALISITVIGQTEEDGEMMRSRIASCDYASRPNVECRCGRRDEVTAAHALGLSFGKYRALLELQELDPNVTAEDIRGLTMRQIRNMIYELRTDTTI